MRVLFINPANVPANDPALLIEPVDVLGLATFAKALGHEAAVVDVDRAGGRFPESLQEGYDYWVIPFDYQTPLFSSEAAAGVVRLAAAGARKGVRIIMGGRPISASPEKFLVHPLIVLIAGEMEGALEKLLALDKWNPAGWGRIFSLIYLSGGRIMRTNTGRFCPIDELPIPDRSLVELDRYIDVRTLLSSRGCVGTCTFCPVTRFWGPWRGRSPARVADEIEYLAKDCKGEKILLLDDNATADCERVRALADELISRRLRTSLGCLATISSFREETFRRMYRAGFRWVHFGVESGSDAVLSRLKKGITAAQAREVVQRTLQIGFRVRTSWIVDPPDCDEASIDETMKLILETGSQEIRIHYFTLRPHSELFERLPAPAKAAEGYIHRPAPLWEHPAPVRSALESGMKRLLCELQERGYHAVSEPGRWDELSREGRTSRFISFCPSRYGIGWEL